MMMHRKYLEDEEYECKSNGIMKKPVFNKIPNAAGDDLVSSNKSHKKVTNHRGPKKSNIRDITASLDNIPKLVSTKIRKIFNKREKYLTHMEDINKRISHNRLQIRKLKARICDEEFKNTNCEGKKFIQVKDSTIYLEILPFKVSSPDCYSSKMINEGLISPTFDQNQGRSRDRCFSTVAYSTFSEIELKLASKIKKYVYYEVLDGNHTFFSKKYEISDNGELHQPLAVPFQWKIKSGNENIRIRLYLEKVSQTASTTSAPKYTIDARIIGEVEFPLK